ncbi:MAG: Peptide chain release factor 1 [Chlamydiae bacterium]|nr:Peptide chain release factor 1 [Chlamydiota bacterium]
MTPKETKLKLEMRKLKILEKDLEEKFILGSGKGGQKVNKTASCVYLKHHPTNIEIKCQKTRSRELNRYYARKALVERIKELTQQELSEKQKLIFKIRKQKKKRSKKAKEKIKTEKQARAKTKKQRQKPDILD